ncbi:hypothetical protein PG911_07000 [Tenacibaculum ovolyticum]|uniref:hypothetical protein n=1 Tax=Tenacibaculum ovolyticum TaxID=104270 RepID=UPI0007EC346B|nr:hypothetical protein [Tenacibaculum ovolyticum]WBX77997.1 hypothetical protein PG911_07000 [Tenacibaculum ovolyticum]
MHKEYIEFKKERDLGAIISDAFKFIRLEGKEFFLTIFKIAAIPILIAVAAMFYYMTAIPSLATQEVGGIMGMFSAMLLMMVAYLVTFVVINLAGMHYIKSYIENNGQVNQEEVTRKTKERFWSFMGFGTLAGIVIVISFLLCFLPVFYTWTVLSLGGSILVFENESGTSAFGKCFSFISGHFWETFGVIIVVGLLVGMLGYIFQIPATIYQFIQMGIGMNSEDPTAVFGLFSDPIYLLLNLVSILGQLMFYSITLITNVFLYFDINEQKNLTGTLEKIDGLGQ